ncbi:MAG TPA: hypothetical protein VJ276_07500 [Thermoanaerobaculia bacterium]|nr:hypothetical protein [Thermoanaerobaculia bacterium]
MAKRQEHLSKLLVHAYYVPLQQAHSTLRSATAVLQTVDGELAIKRDHSQLSDEVFRLAHLLLLHALQIQVDHFGEQKIEAAVDTAIADYLELYPSDDASPEAGA